MIGIDNTILALIRKRDAIYRAGWDGKANDHCSRHHIRNRNRFCYNTMTSIFFYRSLSVNLGFHWYTCRFGYRSHLFHYCISLCIPLKLRGRYQREFETNNNKPRRRHFRKWFSPKTNTPLAKMSPSWSFVEINCAWISFWTTCSRTKS